MLTLLILVPLVLLGVCAVTACLLGGRCERALQERRAGRVYRLKAKPPAEATEATAKSHG